jgi:hypothetical protein
LSEKIRNNPVLEVWRAYRLLTGGTQEQKEDFLLEAAYLSDEIKLALIEAGENKGQMMKLLREAYGMESPGRNTGPLNEKFMETDAQPVKSKSKSKRGRK